MGLLLMGVHRGCAVIVLPRNGRGPRRIYLCNHLRPRVRHRGVNRRRLDLKDGIEMSRTLCGHSALIPMIHAGKFSLLP